MREERDQIEINKEAIIGPTMNPVMPNIEIPPIVVSRIR